MIQSTDKGSELIDKCVGSRIWVVMKGDKGECRDKDFDNLETWLSKIVNQTR